MDAETLIARLNLAPHPEGGHYRETWLAEAKDGDRPAGSCIYFLLTAGERSHWHRVDATEIWHFYAGAPLILSIASTEVPGPATTSTSGSRYTGLKGWPTRTRSGAVSHDLVMSLTR